MLPIFTAVCVSFLRFAGFPPFVLVGAVFVYLAADLLSDGSLAGGGRERVA